MQTTRTKRQELRWTTKHARVFRFGKCCGKLERRLGKLTADVQTTTLMFPATSHTRASYRHISTMPVKTVTAKYRNNSEFFRERLGALRGVNSCLHTHAHVVAQGCPGHARHCKTEISKQLQPVARTQHATTFLLGVPKSDSPLGPADLPSSQPLDNPKTFRHNN